MERKEILSLAGRIVGGAFVDSDKLLPLLNIPDDKISSLLSGADMIRNFRFGNEIHLCAIRNGKSGACSENCAFCAQSVKSKAQFSMYPLLDKEELKKDGLMAEDTPINKYSIVTSGKGLSRKETLRVAESMSELDRTKISLCVSLGILDAEDFEILKKAGVTRYHHNLETARSHFGNICDTHSYEERIKTIKRAQAAGMSVCAGGIFGLGESDEQILEMARDLKNLNVDSIPINFFSPVKGTPLEDCDFLTPAKCLKIIAFFRYFMPDKEILIAGGRDDNLKSLSSMIFYAGASGIMTGDYLTKEGPSLHKDLEMLEQLGMKPRVKNAALGANSA